MSRQERRRIQRDNQKSRSREKRERQYEPGDKWGRILNIVFSLSLIFGSLYMAHRDHSIPDDELSTVTVTLKNAPVYDIYKIKSSTYRDIVLITEEYSREFKITGLTYDATDHDAFKTNIQAGDKIEVKVKKSELENLGDYALWNDYNEVFGVRKNGSSYIDLNIRTELEEKDSVWAYIFVAVGLVWMPYAFIKGKPYIDMEYAIAIVAALGVIIQFLVGYL